MDDRACFAVLADAAEQLKDETLDVALYILGSTQEETHSTGAITAACGIAAAAIELALALRYAAYADVAVTFTVPLVAMLLCALTALAVGADTLIARSLAKRANRGK